MPVFSFKLPLTHSRPSDGGAIAHSSREIFWAMVGEIVGEIARSNFDSIFGSVFGSAIAVLTIVFS
jgi:hypothetical protein